MRVTGKNVFNELDINSIKRIYLSKNFKDKNILDIIHRNNLKYVVSDQKILDKMISHNQGIVVDIDDYKYKDINVIDDNFVIVLDHLEDPHNFGAIIRTSEAALVDAIIIPQDREVQVNSTVMKTSAGALAKMNICRVTNLVQTINKLKDDGFWIVGTAMDGTDYRQIDYSGKIALVVGNEGNGMSRLVRESCDFVASIPMRGEINSLNASVATGIMIYEVVRNRK